jgi:hypothetical protein
MDPYLEDPWIWPDFHLTFVVALRAALLPRVPRRYAVLADRYVWVSDSETETRARLGKPDAFIVEKDEGDKAAAPAAVAAPVEVVLPSLTEKGSPYLKIVDRGNRRLVTVVELLSTANKTPGRDRDAYLLKRCEYLATGVNLVAIDLLRKGERPPWGTPSLPATNYYVMVSRASERPKAGAWPFSVRDSLPPIPIPLNAGDPDVMLSLGDCFTQAYDSAGYDRELDYEQPPNPPLAEPDATWARELLAARLTPPTATQGEHP